MKKILLVAISLASISAMSSDLDFSNCERARSDSSYLTCKVSIMDKAIQEKLESMTLDATVEEYQEAIESQMEKECVSSSSNDKFSGRLRLVSALSCEFNYKTQVYEYLSEL